jgi:hypothetical protein
MTALISVRSGVPDVVTIALDPPPDREPPAREQGRERGISVIYVSAFQTAG